jgi:hypothetical protein
MGPFPNSQNFCYILLAMDYVSKWVEAIPTRSTDNKVVMEFIRTNIFARFGVPRVIISDNGSHFCNRAFELLLRRYGVTHKLATPYHPQTSGQVEVSNRQIKQILEKVINPNRKDWANKLIDALWGYRTAYKSVLGMSPYRVVYGKACHLPVEIEHKAEWAIQTFNADINDAAKKRKLQMCELEEIRNEAFENSKITKEKAKLFHDKKILRKNFYPNQEVLLYNSKLHLFPGKLKSRWEGPFLVVHAFNHGAVEIRKPRCENSFIVNGQRLKPYFHDNLENLEETIALMDPIYEG